MASGFASLGIRAKQTREPGGSPGAEIMRHVLLSGAARPLGPDAEAMLFAAARDDHLTMLIRPALAHGQWVVCDRFADSTRVYQGVVGHVDPWRSARWSASWSATPCRTSPSSSTCRPRRACAAPISAAATAGADRFEGETLAFHETLRDGFLTLATNEPDRCVLIDATMPKEEVAEQIWRVVLKKLDPATAPIQFEDEAV